MKKPILLGTALVASLGLIGGTFAAFIVTDNANPIAIQITPKVLSEDAENPVTLSWGEHSLANLGSITKQFQKAFYANLVADVDYTGYFTATIDDEDGANLVKYITVTAKLEGAQENLLVLNEDKLADTKPVTVESGQAKKVNITVDFDCESDVEFAKMQTESLSLTIDWNKGADSYDASDDQKTQTIYYATDWAEPYAYAWQAESDNQNGMWPGQAMTHVYDNLYRISVKTTMTSIIFSNHGASETSAVALSGFTAAKPYWDGDSWEEIPPQSSTSKEYFLVGNLGEASTWGQKSDEAKLTLMGEKAPDGTSVQYEIDNVNFAAGDEFKIMDGDFNYAWDGGNYVVQEAIEGANIYFSPVFQSAWGGYVYVAAPSNS